MGGGSIANVSSVLARLGSEAGAVFAYCGTKGALPAMSKAAAMELAADNIRVNSLHPGVIDTPMMVFLLSDESSFVTGSEITVDGGFTAH